MAAKKKKDKKAKVHKDLEGLDLKINALGEVESTLDIDQINEFLDKNVEDKKLKNKVEDKEDDKGES